MENKSTAGTYIILTVVLVILSLGGIYFLIKNKPVAKEVSVIETEIPTEIPTQIPEPSIIPTLIATASVTANPTKTIKPTLTPKTTISLTVTPTPAYQVFTSDADKFQVTYSSSRKVYQDKEASGNRYTFYLSTGNIAIHVGTNWSWTYPDRQFNSSLTVSGLPTSVYEISTQKIVDFETNGLKYTIQCVHNGIANLKTECDQFISDFKILSL